MEYNIWDIIPDNNSSSMPETTNTAVPMHREYDPRILHWNFPCSVHYQCKCFLPEGENKWQCTPLWTNGQTWQMMSVLQQQWMEKRWMSWYWKYINLRNQLSSQEAYKVKLKRSAFNKIKNCRTTTFNLAFAVLRPRFLRKYWTMIARWAKSTMEGCVSTN